jgi:hypothetical protein
VNNALYKKRPLILTVLIKFIIKIVTKDFINKEWLYAQITAEVLSTFS